VALAGDHPGQSVYRGHQEVQRGLGSGVEVETAVGHLFCIRDGLVPRWWMFGDAHKARRRFAAGDRPA
jgi:hypothetical protein